MLKQKTLKDSFSLSGKGLHTGLDLTVTFNPAPDNHGYKIQRIDLEGQPTIDAVADNVTETTRGTVLSKNGVKVSTVEHGMAALYALGIDNCLIQVNGPEFPILDGSAQYYVQEIERVGTEEQSAVKDFYIIKSKIEFRDEATGSSIIVLPDENFSLNVKANTIHAIIGPNGSGKTTLLNCISTIDTVSAGHIFLEGTDITEIKPKSLARFRRENLGFIFQDFNLLDTLTISENIALALAINKVPAGSVESCILNITEKLNISDILNKYPYQVSGGQKQR